MSEYNVSLAISMVGNAHIFLTTVAEATGSDHQLPWLADYFSALIALLIGGRLLIANRVTMNAGSSRGLALASLMLILGGLLSLSTLPLSSRIGIWGLAIGKVTTAVGVILTGLVLARQVPLAAANRRSGNSTKDDTGPLRATNDVAEELVPEEVTVGDVTDQQRIVAHQTSLPDPQFAQNTALIRTLLDSSLDCIKVLAIDGRVLTINQAGLRSLEISDAKEIEQSLWQSFWPPEYSEAVNEALAQARSGSVGRFQGLCPTRNGTMKRWDIIVSSIGETSDHNQRLVCISRDITEMHALSKARQETEDRFRMLADNIAQFAWMTNEAGEMLWYNQRWFDYTGATIDQMKGWKWQDFHHPEHQERVMSRFRAAIQDGVDWEDTVPLRGKDGKYRWFLSRARAIRNEQGAVICWLGTNTDITERLAADQALTRTHAQLKSIVDAAADAIITIDSKGQILTANSAVKQIFGYQPKELVGRLIEELIPPHENTHLEAPNGHRLQQMAFLIGKGRECHGRRKDGRAAILETSFSESQVGSKRFLGGIIRDVTDRKRTEEVLRIRTRAIESATNGILITDAQTKSHSIIYVNPAFEQLTGYSADEAIGKDPRFLEGPETNPSQSAIAEQAFQNKQECHVTILHYRKDGSQFWNDLHMSPVEDDAGNVTHFIGIQSDVTSRIRYEHRLREAQEQANSANRSKSQFLANMSHEIRTPLTAILGCADTLVRKIKDPDPKAVVRMIRDQGYLLMAILNDVLDLSKIEAGKLEIRIETCDLVSILGEVYNLMQSQASEKEIKFRIDYRTRIPEQIRTDPVRLRQILLNFVSNAIKFTSAGHVEMQVACMNEKDQARLKITVEDTGIGIAADRLQKIFEAFTQERNPLTSRIPGTGLGLTICQKLVQMLGGTISVTSEEKKGSRFTVDLPLGKLEATALEDAASVSRKSAMRDSKLFDDTIIPCRVLIAEDTRGIQFMMTRMLQDVVAAIKVVENGELAVNEVVQASQAGNAYDIVLMDMQMHVMDGFEATKKLRELGYTLPVIALTASAMAGDRERCLAAGCTDYLAKPIDRKELINKLQQLCDL